MWHSHFNTFTISPHKVNNIKAEWKCRSQGAVVLDVEDTDTDTRNCSNESPIQCGSARKSFSRCRLQKQGPGRMCGDRFAQELIQNVKIKCTALLLLFSVENVGFNWDEAIEWYNGRAFRLLGLRPRGRGAVLFLESPLKRYRVARKVSPTQQSINYAEIIAAS